MKNAVCDIRMPKKALAELEKHCDRIILLPPLRSLAEPVSAHPDMLIFPCPDEGTIYTHPDYLQIAEKSLSCTGYDILPIGENAKKDYPGDILLNAAAIGKFIFGRLPYISSSITEYALRNSIKLVDIKQGYAKCSICKVSDDAIITADPSIEKAALENGIKLLKIRAGFVSLTGYDHGFIGGASGCDGENLYFCGDAFTHPDGKAILDFCTRQKINVISLSDDPLFDVGSILFI